MSNVREITTSNFQSEVNTNGTPVLVDFWAPWCGPCRMIGPELDAVAQELGEKVKIVKVNVDEEPALAEQFGVQSIPNLIVFKEGRPVRQIVGFTDRRTLVKALSEA
jgi:thioredoxin 1